MKVVDAARVVDTKNAFKLGLNFRVADDTEDSAEATDDDRLDGREDVQVCGGADRHAASEGCVLHVDHGELAAAQHEGHDEGRDAGRRERENRRDDGALLGVNSNKKKSAIHG